MSNRRKHHVKLTMTAHQARMVMADAEQHSLVAEDARDRTSWEAIRKAAQKAVEYHQELSQKE